MKAVKLSKGKGRALRVAIIRHGDLFRVMVECSNYELGRDRLSWRVINKTMAGVSFEEAEKAFKARAAA